MATLTRRGTGITQTGWTNPANAYDAGTATFASWASTVALQTNTVYITGYDFAGAGLPSTAGLNSVSFTVKQYVSATNRMLAPQVRAYLGATPLGTQTTLTNSGTTTNSQTVTITGVTIADLRDSTFRVEFIARHYNGTISGTQFLDFIDVVVDYTPASAPTSRTITATSASATSVFISWASDSAFPSPTYTVEQSTNGTSFSAVASGLIGSSYTATGLTQGTLYYFRVIGINSEGLATSNTATATPVAWSLSNTLEGGTDETSISASPSLSGPDPFNLFYSNTAAVYDTAVAKGGTVSMRTQHTTGTTGSSMAGWSFTAATRLPFYTRFYLYVTANPSAATTIVRIGNSADSQIAFLRLNTDGTLVFGTGTPTNTTNAISLSQWVRVELGLTSTSATVRLYNVTESTTVTEEVTQSTSFAAVGTVRYGVNVVTNAGPFWWDSLRTGESWIGPETAESVSGTVTGHWGIRTRLVVPPTFNTTAATLNYSSPSTISITQAQLGNLIRPGDLLVAYLFNDVDPKLGSPASLPTGFTQQDSVFSSGYHIIGYKTAGSSEGTYTTQAGTNVLGQVLTIVVVSNASSFRGYSFTESSATTATMASVNASSSGLLIAMTFMYTPGGRPSPTWSTPMTSRLTQQSSPISYYTSFVGTESVSSGATGTRTSTATTAASSMFTYGVVVR